MPDTTSVVPYESTILSRAQEAIVDLTNMIAEVPEVDEDAWVGIIATLASAQTPEQLNAPWESGSLREWVGKTLRIDSIRRAPSDFAEGLGFYLIVAATTSDGERITVSTGAAAIVVQLVRAHVVGLLPATVLVCESKKPTSKGYRPMHLEFAREG